MSEYSEAFVAPIAKALNSEKVPCVLWGHCLLNVHGVPSIIASVDFVIPDRQLKVGSDCLTRSTHLAPCPDHKVCISSSQERHTPPPAFHMHIPNSEVTVRLYLQSETLWFLPTLDDSLLPPRKVNPSTPFVLASDQTVLPPWRPGRGSGAFPPGLHPVVVPKAHILLEAFMRLYARNVGKRIGSFGIAMIAYMEEYVDDDGLLDVGQLPEPLKTSYTVLKQDKMPVRRWTLELKEALGLPAVLDD